MGMAANGYCAGLNSAPLQMQKNCSKLIVVTVAQHITESSPWDSVTLQTPSRQAFHCQADLGSAA